MHSSPCSKRMETPFLGSASFVVHRQGCVVEVVEVVVKVTPVVVVIARKHECDCGKSV